MTENFSASDPGINVPHMHGSVDSGGGLVSFLNVSGNLKKYILILLSSFFYQFFLLVFYLILNLIWGNGCEGTGAWTDLSLQSEGSGQGVFFFFFFFFFSLL